jgi:hypothetical protein
MSASEQSSVPGWNWSGDDRVALEDALGQDDPGYGRFDERIDVPVGHTDAALLEQLQALGGGPVAQLGFLKKALGGVHLGLGDEVRLVEL